MTISHFEQGKNALLIFIETRYLCGFHRCEYVYIISHTHLCIQNYTYILVDTQYPIHKNDGKARS